MTTRRQHEARLLQMREASHIKEVKAALVRSFLVIAYFALCLYLPALAGGQRDPACKFNVLLANCYFAFLLVGLIFLANLVNAAVFLYDRRTLFNQGIELTQALKKNYFRTVVFTFLVSLFGYGGWFWAVQFMWVNFDPQTCLKGWNLLDFANFLVLQIYCAAFAAMLGLLVLCAPCCCQRVCQVIRVLRSEQVQEGESDAETEKIIGQLVHTNFDSSHFKAMQECAICFVNYHEDDPITPLPCSQTHYFHSACLETWLHEKAECPLCRKPVDLRALEEQRASVCVD